MFWYEKASQQGWFEASMMLGRIYLQGEDEIEPDMIKARYYNEIAAASGDASALHGLGNCCSGVPSDLQYRIQHLQRSAEGDYPLAQADLAQHYYEGNGVPKSFDIAIRWALKTADQGVDDAQSFVARLLSEKYNAHYLQEPPPKVVYWMRRAAEQLNPDRVEVFRLSEKLFRFCCATCNAIQGSSDFPSSIKLTRCSQCKTIYYCGRDCQRADWIAGHKKKCLPKNLDERSPEERIAFFYP